MASRKISELTALTAPASADVLPIVDVSEALPENQNKKITYAELLSSAPAGTAAAPSFAFDGDTNTGIYSPGADQVAISTGGSGRLFVNATGEILAGTSTSVDGNWKIQANAAANALTGIGVNNNGGYGVYLIYDNSARYSGAGVLRNIANSPLAFETNNTERLRITSAGFVGIGTSSPGSTLHVAGAPGTSTTSNLLSLRSLSAPNASNLAQVDFWCANNGNGLEAVAAIRALNPNAAANNGGALTFAVSANGSVTTPTERMRIDQAGNVGIGTTSPGSLLDVRGADGRFAVGDTSGPALQGGYSSGGSVIYLQAYNTTSPAFVDFNINGSSVRFGTGASATERARIDSSGRLLVGTSSGGGVARLQVQGSTLFNDAFLDLCYNGSGSIASGTSLGVIRFTDQASSANIFAQISCAADAAAGTNDYPGRLVFSTTADGASSPTEACRIDSSQRLLVGRTGPDGSALIQAPATSSIPGYCSATGVATAVTHFEFRNSNGLVGTISTNASATAYNTSSDYRLKENVAPVTDGITRLQRLKPSRFSFIADPTKTVDGFLAHEAAEVVPECVTGDKDAVDDEGNPVYQGIDQSKLVPLLTAALQEAIAKIETLEARLTAAGL